MTRHLFGLTFLLPLLSLGAELRLSCDDPLNGKLEIFGITEENNHIVSSFRLEAKGEFALPELGMPKKELRTILISSSKKINCFQKGFEWGGCQVYGQPWEVKLTISNGNTFLTFNEGRFSFAVYRSERVNGKFLDLGIGDAPHLTRFHLKFNEETCHP